MTKKELLIVELKEEEARLPKKDYFGDDNHLEQYEHIYAYLETGVKHPGNNDHWNLYMLVTESLGEAFRVYL